MPSVEPFLSLCMIVKNESFFLRDCLRQAADHVEEIIVVDTGSTDSTRDIAREFTDNVFEFEWQDHFADARNYSLEQAKGQWIIVLDADEVIAPEHWAEIRQLIAHTDKDAFFLTQRNYSIEPMEKEWVPISQKTLHTHHYKGYRPNPIARLFRNLKHIRYRGRVHEVVDRNLQEGCWEVTSIPIHHHMDEDPSKMAVDRQLNYLRIIEQDLDNEQDGRLWTAAGSICMYYVEDLPKAMTYLQRAVELDYKVNENSEMIAEGHYRLGDLDSAYKAYLSLYQSGYRSVNLGSNLANLAVKRGELSFAADLLEEALELGVFDAGVRLRLEHNIKYLREQTH
ncbi:MAG: glycosyltransferase family 2 protein [Halioglobus sp.]